MDYTAVTIEEIKGMEPSQLKEAKDDVQMASNMGYQQIDPNLKSQLGIQ